MLMDLLMMIYASFKYGEFEKNGRYFLDLNESTINKERVKNT